MKKYIFILTLLIFSCKDQSKGLSDIVSEESIKIEVKDAVVEDFTKIIDVKSLIPLKTGDGVPIIGTFDKVLFTKNKIVVLDKLTESIYFFNKKGDFVSRIAGKGRGPSEYTSIYNISVTLPDTLNVIDNDLKSIIKYKFDGEYIETNKIDGYPEDYIKKNNYEYVSIYSNYLSNNNYYLNIRDQKNIQTGYFPYLGFIVSNQVRPTIFFTNTKDLFYHHHFDDNIYKLDNKELQIAYKIDFGKFSYPTEKLLKAKDPDEFRKILKKEKYIGNIFNINITDRYLYFNYDNGSGYVNTYVKNLKTQTNYHYTGLENVETGISSVPIASDGTFFYSMINPWEYTKADLKKLNVKYNLELTPQSKYSVLVKYNYK
jgi:hypothetical protein